MTERDDLAREALHAVLREAVNSGGDWGNIVNAVIAAGWVSPAEAAALRQQRDAAAAKVADAWQEGYRENKRFDSQEYMDILNPYRGGSDEA